MTDIQIYILVTTLLYLFFGVMFRSDTMIDAMFKYSFILMALVGLFLYMKSMGYIIKL